MWAHLLRVNDEMLQLKRTSCRRLVEKQIVNKSTFLITQITQNSQVGAVVHCWISPTNHDPCGFFFYYFSLLGLHDAENKNILWNWTRWPVQLWTEMWREAEVLLCKPEPGLYTLCVLALPTFVFHHCILVEHHWCWQAHLGSDFFPCEQLWLNTCVSI